MNKAKHILCSVCLIVLCLGLTVTAMALRVGDTVDFVLSTDIRAFINGYEIPAYNISGRLGVVAEDLLGYGFSVEWNGEARTLSIRRNEGAAFAPIAVHSTSHAPIGTPILPVLHTDIVTDFDGETVESFNIDGRTIVYFSELARYGSHAYDNDVRMSMVSFDKHAFAKTTIVTLPEKIIHAGGAIHERVGSNSLEALNYSYSKGQRFIEMDFVLSSDGIPVCLHDWSQFYSNALGSEPITAEAFSRVRIFNFYTSVTLDSLVTWLGTHPDVYIVTDIKEDNVGVLRQIAQKHPEIMTRLIPQIYQYDEYTPVRAMGYSNIILTLYRLPTYEDKVNVAKNVQFAQKNGLLAVTADVTLVDPAFAEAFASAGVPLYVHTVNDTATQESLRQMGVHGVYTDFAD